MAACVPADGMTQWRGESHWSLSGQSWSHGLLGAGPSVGAEGWAVSLAGVCGGGGTIPNLSDAQMICCGKSLEAFMDEVIFELSLEG